MSLDESERLLKGAEQDDYNKAATRETIGIVLLLGTFGLIALALWLLSLVIGPTPAGIIGLIAVMIWLGRKE